MSTPNQLPKRRQQKCSNSIIANKYEIPHHLLHEVIDSIRQKLQLLLMSTNRPCILQMQANHVNKLYAKSHIHTSTAVFQANLGSSTASGFSFCPLDILINSIADMSSSNKFFSLNLSTSNLPSLFARQC